MTFINAFHREVCMTAGAKTKLQVDGVISIRSPSATNKPQASELTHRVLSLGKRRWVLIVLSSMMLLKRSFGFMRSLFILYVHEHDCLDFEMLTVETAVFDCIYWFNPSRDRKGQSHPVENYLELVEEYSKGKIHKSEPEPGNGNVNTVYFVHQARGNTRVCLRWTSTRLQMFTYI